MSPATTSRRAPEEKQELLLSAARELFAEQGFNETSTLQIANCAGVSEGILFHHFGSKRGLFVRLAEDYARAASAATMPADPTQMTEETVLRGAFDFAESNPALYQMLMKGGPELAELGLSAQSDIMIRAIQKNLERGMEHGQVRRGDAEVMAQLQFAVVDAAYKAWRINGDPARKEDYIVEAINCMKAMLAPATPHHPQPDSQADNQGEDT
jgi:AcrR family transcriptional regulator